LSRPTFFEHFDGVKVDYEYFYMRDPKQLQREQDWLNKQGVRVVVDFSRKSTIIPILPL